MSHTPLSIPTPCLHSPYYSQRLGCHVWLKLELLQPVGSFKIRGIGHFAQILARQGAKRFVSSSGGNAGLAVAYAGQQLGIPVTVVVPQSTTQRAIALIQRHGATVQIEGNTWQEAHQVAEAMATARDTAYIHPFDHPLIWEGHTSMIDELTGVIDQPDAVVVAVGGGGLLCGVLDGLANNGWKETSVIAVETEGAASLAGALAAGQLITLDDITTIATTLGAKRVAEGALTRCQSFDVTPHIVSDKDAIDGCITFAREHRMLVEPACGAALAWLDNPSMSFKPEQHVVMIVCGGAGVTPTQLQEWRTQIS